MTNKTPHVAVVDDDAFVLRALRRLFRSLGFDVDTYASGEEFLSAATNHELDCVVLDLHMPGASGFEVQARLAQQARPIPVIVLTADDTPAARSCALQLGATAYLIKPVDQQTLINAITEALARH